jgi:hypothetical protein
MASTNDEAGDFLPLPAYQWRLALDPKLGDLTVNGVRDFAGGIGAAHLRYAAVRLIHGFHVHATEALPANDGQHRVARLTSPRFCAPRWPTQSNRREHHQCAQYKNTYTLEHCHLRRSGPITWPYLYKRPQQPNTAIFHIVCNAHSFKWNFSVDTRVINAGWFR